MLSLIAGCTDASEDAGTTAQGACTYDDAGSDADGNPQEPARPDPASIAVSIEVEGSGDIQGLEPSCTLDGATGSFTGLFSGEGSIDDGGVYAAALASSSARFTTPSGCDIPQIDISSVTDVVVRGEIEATTERCQSYCEARARAYGEAECSGSSDQASCRSAAEAEYQTSCTTTCDRSENVIVAETRLSAAAIAEINARSLSGAALGEISADLRFERVENGSGEVLDEAP